MYRPFLALVAYWGAMTMVSLPLVAKEPSLNLSVHSLDINKINWKEHLAFKDRPNRIDFDLGMKQIFTNAGTHGVGIVFSNTLWFKIDTHKFDVNTASVKTSISRCEWSRFASLSRPFDWENNEAIVASQNLKVIDAVYKIRGLPVQLNKRQDFGICLLIWFVELDGTSHWARPTTWVVSFLKKKGHINITPMSPEIVDLFAAASTRKHLKTKIRKQAPRHKVKNKSHFISKMNK